MTDVDIDKLNACKDYVYCVMVGDISINRVQCHWKMEELYGRDKNDRGMYFVLHNLDQHIRLPLDNFGNKFIWTKYGKQLYDFLETFDFDSVKEEEYFEMLEKESSAKAQKRSEALIDREVMKAQTEIARQEFMARKGFREFNDEDERVCRICNKDLDVDGIPRVNDHLVTMVGYIAQNKPICSECSDNKPDEYHLEFQRRYWKEKKVRHSCCECGEFACLESKEGKHYCGKCSPLIKKILGED